MSNSIVFRSNKVLRKPRPDTPKIPDIESGLVAGFYASDVPGSPGDTVGVWRGRGTGSLNMRTLEYANPADASASMNKPTIGFNKFKYVDFDGSSRLITRGVDEDYTQPLTYTGVFRYDPTVRLDSARIFGGILTNRFNSLIASSTSGNLIFRASGTDVLPGFQSSEWIVLVWCVNGANSHYKINDGNYVQASGGVRPQAGFTLGAGPSPAYSAGSKPGQVMQVAEWSVFDREFTQWDAAQFFESRVAKYNL